MSQIRRCTSNSENLNYLPTPISHTPCSSTFKRSDDSATTTANRNKFEATRKWHDMIHAFIDEVPRADCRKFLKTYSDSFSGQSAADVLTDILPRIFTDRKCERVNAVRVLEKFISDSIIEDVSGGKQFKDDTTLFRLTDKAITKYSTGGPPPKVRRAASLNDKDRATPVCTTKGDYSRPVKLTKSGSFKQRFRSFHSKTSQNFAFNSSQSFQTPVRRPDNESPPLAQSTKRFARVIDYNNDDLESRRQFLDTQLTGLLDGLIADKNLTELERHRKLMDFKHNYPKIFSVRYPDNSYVAPPTPLLHRIKDFLGGN